VLLEWVLILEGLTLAILGVLAVVGMIMGRQEVDETDIVSVFVWTFWKEFLWPPEVMAIDTDRLVAREPVPSGPARPASSAAADEPDEEDEFYGRTRKTADGREVKTDLAVIVIPHAPSDSVLGRDGEGIKLQVTGEAGDSKSNKALIELVAAAIGAKPYQVTLTKGHYHPRKTVQIQGLSFDELQIRLSGLNEAE
jgi:uncharacterized protein YggU (UPF0235/DUF167 family)